MSDKQPALSEAEREFFQSSVRRLLESEWPSLKALSLSEQPLEVRRIWDLLASVGVADLGRDPEMGGLREILLVFEELGAACCPAPLLGSVVANLLASRSEGPTTVFPATPQPTYAVAFGQFDGDRAAGAIEMRGGRLTGAVHFVEGVAAVDRNILFVNEPSGVVLIGKDAAGLRVEHTPALSLPSLASLYLQDCWGEFAPFPPQVLRDVTHIARLAAAARALGAAQRAYDLVVEHAKTRKQFGKVIGQFQAVQHRLVDNLTRLDGARLTLDAAASAYDEELQSWRTFANLSLANLNPGLRQLAIDMHQLMGAIGYSEEHELPRHFRQIHGNVSRFGGLSRARAAIGEYLVGPAQ